MFKHWTLVSKNKKRRLVCHSCSGVWKTLFKNQCSKLWFLKSSPGCFQTIKTNVQWQLCNYLEHYMAHLLRHQKLYCLLNLTHTVSLALKKCYLNKKNVYFGQRCHFFFFFLNQTHIPNTFLCFLNTKNMLFKPWYQTYFLFYNH